jgi:hypothetical protein
MKSVLLFIGVLFVLNGFSQDRYLGIYHPGATKESVFKENTRIRVKTVEGGKLSGKFHFVDENQVMIKNIIIPLSSIAEIKHNPLLLNLLVSGTLLVAGGFCVGVGIVGVAWGETIMGIIVGAGGAAIMYAGFKAPNFLPKIHINDNTTVKMKNVLQ